MRTLRTVFYFSILLLLAAAAGAQVHSQIIQGSELVNFLLKAEFGEAKSMSVGITSPKKD